jgi:hypothetical protein
MRWNANCFAFSIIGFPIPPSGMARCSPLSPARLASSCAGPQGRGPLARHPVPACGCGAFGPPGRGPVRTAAALERNEAVQTEGDFRICDIWLGAATRYGLWLTSCTFAWQNLKQILLIAFPIIILSPFYMKICILFRYNF